MRIIIIAIAAALVLASPGLSAQQTQGQRTPAPPTMRPATPNASSPSPTTTKSVAITGAPQASSGAARIPLLPPLGLRPGGSVPALGVHQPGTGSVSANTAGGPGPFSTGSFGVHRRVPLVPRANQVGTGPGAQGPGHVAANVTTSRSTPAGRTTAFAPSYATGAGAFPGIPDPGMTTNRIEAPDATNPNVAPQPGQQPVPEPETWALFLLGLSAVAFGVWRHLAREGATQLVDPR